jgi:lipoprotein NlpI
MIWLLARVALAIGAVTIASAPLAAAPTEQQLYASCTKQGWLPPQQRISACTAAIESGPWKREDLAWAFGNRAAGYLFAGDLDHAIADAEEALRIDPTDPVALGIRGSVYIMRRDYDRAIADYDDAIRLSPRLAQAFNNRGSIHRAKGDNDRAIADFDAAIRLDPKEFVTYYNRGLAKLFSGALAEARADFEHSRALDPKNAYAALWLAIVERRSNRPSRLADAVPQLDMTKWPAPVVRLYLGEMTPEALLAAAQDPHTETKARQICEVDLLMGELALQRGPKDEAARLFRLALTHCRKNTNPWADAGAELKALGAQP